MKNLKERWKKAIYNPFWWAVVFMLVVMVILFSGEGYGAGFEVTIQNTTGDVVWVQIYDDDASTVDQEYKIEPLSKKDVPIDYGEYYICIAKERISNGEKTHDVFRCFHEEITEENLYDEDGNKLYFEISE